MKPAPPVMTVLSADVADEGYYYCRVGMTTSAETTDSQSALLALKILEAHWTMDSANFDGAVYQDITGNGHDADPNGDPVFALGADDTTADGAVTIGKTGWATADTWNPSEKTNALTISAWVNLDGTGTAANGVVCKRDDWGAAEGMWQLAVNANGGIWFASSDSGLTVGVGMPANEWHHIGATLDADGTLILFYDGEQVGEEFGITLGDKTDASVTIGHMIDASEGTIINTFNGMLDDVRIYNYAQTPEEIAIDYYATSKEGVCLTRPAFDVSGPGIEGAPDCRVNLYDFAAFAIDWLGCGWEPQIVCP